jgi:hypothetical protein
VYGIVLSWLAGPARRSCSLVRGERETDEARERLTKFVLELVEGFLKELKLVLKIVKFFCLLVQQPWLGISIKVGAAGINILVRCTSKLR